MADTIRRLRICALYLRRSLGNVTFPITNVNQTSTAPLSVTNVGNARPQLPDHHALQPHRLNGLHACAFDHERLRLRGHLRCRCGLCLHSELSRRPPEAGSTANVTFQHQCGQHEYRWRRLRQPHRQRATAHHHDHYRRRHVADRHHHLRPGRHAHGDRYAHHQRRHTHRHGHVSQSTTRRKHRCPTAPARTRSRSILRSACTLFRSHFPVTASTAQAPRQPHSRSRRQQPQRRSSSARRPATA